MKKLFVLFFSLVVGAFVSSPVFAFDLTMGNEDPDNRPYIDSYHNFSIVDTNHPSGYEGVVTQIQYYARNTNPFKFLIVDENKQVEWKSDLIVPSAPGQVHTYVLTTPVEVQVDWNIGMYFQSNGTIPYDLNSGADDAYYEGNNAGEPIIGEVLTVAGYTPRYYSLLASGWSYESDADKDGVPYSEDYCKETTADGSWESDKVWGTNRWEVREEEDGSLAWYQNKPAGKTGTSAIKVYDDLNYTHGCNGHEILDLLKAKFGSALMVTTNLV
jgi:hypothetical protein